MSAVATASSSRRTDAHARARSGPAPEPGSAPGLAPPPGRASERGAASARASGPSPSPTPAPHRLAELYVDSHAIARNTRHFGNSTSATIMAVLKADAFGHGDAARIALQNGASWIGVASIPEALALRAEGIDAPMLSWLNPIDADAEGAISNGVDLAVSSIEQLYAFAAAARRLRMTARIHLHLDVGMARDGAPSEGWAALCVSARALEKTGRIAVVGIMGHLSCAESPDAPQNAIERQRFVNGVSAARRRGLSPRELHLAASAATLHRPDCHFTLCRIGAGLYGIDPAGRAQLEPALTLTAPVTQLRRVRANVGVGYGHDHVTDAATTLAVLPLGYADGLPRAAQGQAEVSIRGRRHPVVGRISMDQLVVDTGRTPVVLGDIAVIMGPGTRGEPTVRNWANWAGTIEHEIVTRLGVRHSRVLRTTDARWAR